MLYLCGELEMKSELWQKKRNNNSNNWLGSKDDRWIDLLNYYPWYEQSFEDTSYIARSIYKESWKDGNNINNK